MGTSINEIVNSLRQGVGPTPEAIDRGFDGVLAVDTWQRWAAALCLTVLDGGDWSSDIYLFQEADSDRWEDMCTSGFHGGDWARSCGPEIDPKVLLLPGQSAGCGVEGKDGSDIPMVAQAGYAAPTVHAIEVTYGGTSRKVAVWPQFNAFVILGPAGLWSLTPIDEEQAALAAAMTIDCS